MADIIVNEWSWWIGRDEELYSEQCVSREEALQIVNSDYDTAYICEAIKRPLKLSDCFDAMQFMENADEGVWDEHTGPDGDELFVASVDQTRDLEAMVRRAMDAWQEKHGLSYVPWLFSEQRNVEYVESDAYKLLVAAADKDRGRPVPPHGSGP